MADNDFSVMIFEPFNNLRMPDVYQYRWLHNHLATCRITRESGIIPVTFSGTIRFNAYLDLAFRLNVSRKCYNGTITPIGNNVSVSFNWRNFMNDDFDRRITSLTSSHRAINNGRNIEITAGFNANLHRMATGELRFSFVNQRITTWF